MDKYQGQRQPPFLATPYKLIDCPEFIRWIGTAECRVWHTMVRSVIRVPMRSGLAKKIYNDYYKKGKVAMAFKLEEIAKKTGISSAGHISEHIKNMENKGYIIKHPDKWLGRSIIVYELGVHDSSVNNWETLHLHTKMVENKAKDTIKMLADSE